MGRLGPMEIMIIAVVALLVIGPRKLPELARAVGRSLTEFRRGVRAAAAEAVVLEETGAPGEQAGAQAAEPGENSGPDSDGRQELGGGQVSATG